MSSLALEIIDERSEQLMKIVYTQDNCPACVFTKAKLKAQNIEFMEMNIGKDISVEDFRAKFPHVRSVPYVIDGEELPL